MSNFQLSLQQNRQEPISPNIIQPPSPFRSKALNLDHEITNEVVNENFLPVLGGEVFDGSDDEIQEILAIPGQSHSDNLSDSALAAQVNSEPATSLNTNLKTGVCNFKPVLEGNSLMQSLPRRMDPLILAYVEHKEMQTDTGLNCQNLPWPPKIPVAAYLGIPGVHRFLWQLLDDEKCHASAILPNLNLIPYSFREQVTVTPLLGQKRLRDLRRLLFEHAVMEPMSLGLGKNSDLALFLESTVHKQIFSLCRAATLTWVSAKGSKAYFSDKITRSFVLSIFDEKETCSWGQCGVHPTSGENY